MAYISMEGSAGYWFQFWKEKARNQSWVGLKEVNVARFRERSKGTIFERLATIKQIDSVDEFIKEFESLVGQTPKLPEEILLGYFMEGLQETICNQVR